MTRSECEMSTPSSSAAAPLQHADEEAGCPRHSRPAEADSLLVRLFWLFAIVVVHAMWGIYPVVARWLQTQPADPLPSLRLTFYINAFACLALATFVTLPRLALQSRRAVAAASPEEKQPMVGISAGSDGTLVEQPHPSRKQAAADIGVLAVSLAVLAAGAVTASRLTSAFIVQLIFTSSPLITAVLSSLTTHEPWPPKLWETLGLTLLGSAMVVTGSLRSSNHGLTWRDPLGIVVALAATIGISVYFVWVKRTESWLSATGILYINYGSVFAFAPLCSVLFEGGRWSSILHWTVPEWAALLYQAIGVYGVAKFTQQLIIRRLGAGVYAMFISLRLVFAIVGSYLILGETITSFLEAVGCVIVCLSVSSYLWIQLRASQHESQPTTAATGC